MGQRLGHSWDTMGQMCATNFSLLAGRRILPTPGDERQTCESPNALLLQTEVRRTALCGLTVCDQGWIFPSPASSAG